MPWAPGQSGNPRGYSGPRNRRRHEVFDEIKKLGHRDALLTLSTIQHESQDESLKIVAATALAPFAHPKLQALPTPRYIERPFELPEFTTVQEAERILAKIAMLYAKRELDSQSSTELTAMLQAWIQARTASDIEARLVIVEQAMDLAPHNGTPAVTGGLPRLPGCDVIMPGDNGHRLPVVD